DDLSWRGLVYAITDPELEKVLNETSSTFYLGADPTADSLHVGHLLAYMVAKRLMDYGHKPILVIGGGTGLIGDPSFKNAERQLLTIETSLQNAEGIVKQVKHLLPEANIVNNYEWLSSLNAIEFLRDIGKNFNISYMMSKDSVKSRIDNGISFTEFSYQIIQAWDFEHLFKTRGCTIQIGGQDQWGNITSGLELIRKMDGVDSKAYGFTFPLVTKSDGTKFGKSESGSIWLDPNKTSAYEFYQFWINTSDDDAINRLKQFTFLTKAEIDAIETEFLSAPHLRTAQKRLAEELTTMVHGKCALDEAIKITNALFSGDILGLTLGEIEIAFKEFDSFPVEENLLLLDILVLTSLAQSKRQAREFIQNGAIQVNGEKITDTEFIVEKQNAFGQTYSIIRKGKKSYILLKH
ncbi:MAG: tyrosine--tRNA ligase, partial [Candidatus Izemoplasmatales bacterium]|nr:tyrosine--tRNA ligase [Candidatus Izemoplasmatales bacterium]